MKMVKKLNKFILIVIFLCIASPVWATVNVTVMAIDGSPSLKFDRVVPGLNNTKQIRVRINASGGRPYQVFQRLLGPVTNEKGEALNLMAVDMASMASSNASGTLYMSNVDHLRYSEQLVYASSRLGDSDSFVIAYSPRPDMLNTKGHFTGRLIFAVREAGDSVQNEASVDFILDSDGIWKASIEGGKNPKEMKVSDNVGDVDFVKVAFSGNSGRNIRIYQEFYSFPQNDAGEEFKLEALKVNVDGSSEGLRVHGDLTMTRARMLIYEGAANEDAFRVSYMINRDALNDVDEGIYRGKLKYTVETDAGSSEYTIDLQCKVNPIFQIDVSGPAEGLSFGKILPSTPILEKEITITVKTNLHKPYQVVQNMSSLLTNEQGKEFDKRYFSFKVDIPSGQSGATRFNNLSTVELGDYPIYASDSKGSPASFKVLYQLKGYSDMSPGNFLVPLTYSLNQN